MSTICDLLKYDYNQLGAYGKEFCNGKLFAFPRMLPDSQVEVTYPRGLTEGDAARLVWKMAWSEISCVLVDPAGQLPDRKLIEVFPKAESHVPTNMRRDYSLWPTQVAATIRSCKTLALTDGASSGSSAGAPVPQIQDVSAVKPPASEHVSHEEEDVDETAV